jgi:hypothetical protein
MSYKVIQVHMLYEENLPSEVAVLWQSNERGWVRASYFTTKPCPGYGSIEHRHVLSPEFIQEVAGYGMNLPDEKKKLYFPGKKMWER